MGEGMRHLLAVDLDAPVPVVVSPIFGVRAEASGLGTAERARSGTFVEVEPRRRDLHLEGHVTWSWW